MMTMIMNHIIKNAELLTVAIILKIINMSMIVITLSVNIMILMTSVTPMMAVVLMMRPILQFLLFIIECLLMICWNASIVLLTSLVTPSAIIHEKTKENILFMTMYLIVVKIVTNWITVGYSRCIGVSMYMHIIYIYTGVFFLKIVSCTLLKLLIS